MPPKLTPKSVLPVFARQELIPEKCKTAFLCKACEDVSGKGSIDGATRCNGLWRVLPFNEVARAKILTKGITLLGKHVMFSPSNPFRLNSSGGENQGTILYIDQLPFSFGMDAVERCLIEPQMAEGSMVRWLPHFLEGW